MAEIYSFPNNVDEFIGAEPVMKWLHGRTSGVFSSGNNLQVLPSQGEMAVLVADGYGWMSNDSADGIAFWNYNEKEEGTKLKLTVDAADSSRARIDRVIVEWKTTNYADLPEIKILKGTVADTPTAPALTNSNTVRQISLARISVAAGSTSITTLNITDERLDATVCGLVTESISIDTTDLHNKYNAAIEEMATAIAQAWEGEIPDGSITESKIQANSISDSKLQDGSVTSSKLDDASVSTDKIADDAVTPDKLDRAYATLNANSKVTAEQASSDVVTASASFTVDSSYAGKMVMCQSADITITIPTGLPSGTEFEVLRYGTNTVTFAAGTGVTLLSVDNLKSIESRYGVAVAKKITGENWLISGCLG